MSFDTLLFRCAICQRDIRDYPGRFPQAAHLKPICRMCERSWTERTGKPKGGTMMDRRKAMSVAALATALECEANALKWKHRYDIS